MALINCPECNREISDMASHCPQCGYPISKYIKANLVKTDNERTLLKETVDTPIKTDVMQKTDSDMKAHKSNTKEEREKKALTKKRVEIILISAVVLAIIVWFGMTLKDDMYRGESRNIDTDYIEEGFTNVYADVVSIEPVHFVYEYKATNSGMTYGDGNWGCSCSRRDIFTGEGLSKSSKKVLIILKNRIIENKNVEKTP